jgi:D-alanine-D-alanine ligase
MGDIRPQLILLFGGDSPEHDVSCSSARHVLEAISIQKYNLSVIGIDRSGRWHESISKADLENFSDIPNDLLVDGPLTSPEKIFNRGTKSIPTVFPVLHGPNGEDGRIQGLLDSYQVPYVGSGVLSSALCMDKIKAKELLSAHAIDQVPWAGYHASSMETIPTEISNSGLSYPLFVKPANMGSSIGVSKVTNRSEINGALDLAAQFDDWIIVEQASSGREIEIAILDGSPAIASIPGEIIPSATFYDYNDKYEDGALLHVPAELDAEEIAAVQQIALNVFKVMRCEGLARIDFFYEQDKNCWLVNEVNTMPGFTPISMFPKLWAATGVTYKELIQHLIDSAQNKSNS